ncbi:glycosyltransferase family 4 protein [Virgibacillus sp. NKC19-3]|uniref:glycosyltransferase family 4 protein n=1 Tax=Virgibacillus saliphilus TaxID=2831674 RepID=UPI001C9A39B8|nr:glycosyltransferase family 4 protein [Virgibacillus sp. NKC19-3]MBY7142196.1 glycosyltransferase family 4 protein [Virgibacillus sp. NKC19-3]
MKILLVPGGPGWAFDHRAKDLLSLRFSTIQFELKYVNKVKTADQFAFDIIYPMSINIAKKLHERTGIPYKRMATGITSVRVMEKYMLEGSKIPPFIHAFRGINTASDEIIQQFKNELSIYKTRVGINEKQFKPRATKKGTDEFVVGWVGRTDQHDYRKLKGYDIALAALKDLPVTFQTRTFKHKVPREEMVNFYQGLDCFICSSSSEHIPLPVLEAASCGVPVISTKVGIVPELITNNKNGLIVPRKSAAFREAVENLIDNPKMRRNISKNSRKTVLSAWTLEKCKSEWESFFLSLR